MSLVPPSGRTGLAELKVTPMVYLQLKQELNSGKQTVYNKTQLEIAFRRYLMDNKGKVKSTKKDMDDLDKFASTYVRDGKKALAEQQKSSHGSTSQKEREAQKFLKDRGLLPAEKKDLPDTLHVEKTPQEQTEQNIRRAEIAEALIEVAASSEPATAVAVGLLLHGLQRSLSNKVTEIFIDKYEKRAHTDEEKDLCLLGMNKVMSNDDKLTYGKELGKLQSNETDPERMTFLAGLQKPINPKEEFQENIQMLEKDTSDEPTYEPPVRALNSAKNPFEIPSAPKPSDAWLAGKAS